MRLTRSGVSSNSRQKRERSTTSSRTSVVAVIVADRGSPSLKKGGAGSAPAVALVGPARGGGHVSTFATDEQSVQCDRAVSKPRHYGVLQHASRPVSVLVPAHSSLPAGITRRLPTLDQAAEHLGGSRDGRSGPRARVRPPCPSSG